MLKCDHCLIEFPDHEAVYDQSSGSPKVFCCHGCQGVYWLINTEGLDEFYRRRREWQPGPAAARPVDVASFSPHVRSAGDEAEIDIVLEGIRCASCVWLNEKILSRTRGVTFARVNYATHRARIRWNPGQTTIGALLDRITSVGYTPKPFVASEFEEEQRKISRDLLFRFGTAGFFSMQLMLFTTALYAGYFHGMETNTKNLFNVIALALTTPVLFYSGWPFLTGAIRGLRQAAFNMDFLIIAGAGSAYVYSIYQMVRGGEVYFDTAAMIITLILLGRLIEAGAKRKASEAITRLIAFAPQEARKLFFDAGAGDGTTAAERRMVALSSVRPGDLIEVVPGEKAPLDGIVREGASEIDESMLTGESRPLGKKKGSEVFGGTMNLYGRLVYEVTRIGSDTVLARIIRAVEDAQTRRAPLQALADRVVGIFVPLVLLLSLATAAYWYWTGSPAAVSVMNAVAVLVIACPCALGLATPLALLIGTSRGASLGILIKGGDVIERSNKINVVVFDKTGTITEGKPSLRYCRGIGRQDQDALQLAASLERYSEHSIGRAVTAAARNLAPEEVVDFIAVPGKGIRGTICGRKTLLGNREFIETEGIGRKMIGDETELASFFEADGATVVYLASNGALAGVLAIADAPRTEAAEAIALLETAGHEVVMMTGDAATTASAVAKAVGIGTIQAERSPLQKAEEIRTLHKGDKHCIMIGDGVNDAPALVEARVGVAMGRSTDIALESADMVLMRNDLRLVPKAISLAKQTFRIIRQNLFWAFFYNAVAIPLAIAGVLHPILAAGTMALSSLTVVGNSLRLRRY